MPTLTKLALLLLCAAAPAAAAAPTASGHLVLAQAEDAQEEAAPSAEAETAPQEAAPAEETEAAPAAETAPAEETEAAPQEEAAPAEETEAAPADEGEARPEAAEGQPAQPAAEDGILRSESAMPEPVRETWRALIEAAESGRIENLQPIIEDQPEPPMVAFDDVGDPIAHLRSLSGDAEGREVLAILLEVLEAGFLHVDEGTPQEMYLWPYFARHPVDELTPSQMVELFTLLTAGDYQDMLSYGAYIFFRVGIAPDGRWLFFLAGD